MIVSLFVRESHLAEGRETQQLIDSVIQMPGKLSVTTSKNVTNIYARYVSESYVQPLINTQWILRSII
jgi:hypothetical protein